MRWNLSSVKPSVKPSFKVKAAKAQKPRVKNQVQAIERVRCADQHPKQKIPLFFNNTVILIKNTKNGINK